MEHINAERGRRNPENYAREVISNQVVLKTKRTYDAKLERLTQYLKQKYPEQIVSDSIVLPLPMPIVEEFFGFVSQHENGKMKSISDVGGYCSAIAYLYRLRAIDSTQTKAKLSEFMSGYKRLVASAKQSGEMPMQEGKQPFTFESYRMLSNIALKQEIEIGTLLFAQLYLVLCWNLMARSCSVASLMYQHITWTDDSLVVTIPRHKGDQEGTNTYPKHVYANPTMPELCPVLSLGLHVLCTTYRVEGKMSIYL
jgi:hypothetical protein